MSATAAAAIPSGTAPETDRPVLDRAAARLPPIALAELTAAADLQHRVDRKYLVPADVFAAVIARFADRLSTLQIGGRRSFRYRSVYFDTPDLDCYRHHVQGRRRRVKVRTRSYPDTGTCLFEVKSKGGRSQTLKNRLDYPFADGDRITAAGSAFAAGLVAAPELVRRLRPVLSTEYHRTTLLDLSAGTRLTCDVDLTFAAPGAVRTMPPGTVLVESKSPGRAAPIDRALLAAGVRPVSVSKYCVGIALLYPQMRSNPWHRLLRRYFTEATPQRDRQVRWPDVHERR